MRRLLVLLALILTPVAAGAADFKCDEAAFDLAACTDPADLSTCPSVCVDPNDPLTCAVLPLPELPVLARQLADQPILRQVTVLEGPFTGVTLSRVALSAVADGIFKAPATGCACRRRRRRRRQEGTRLLAADQGLSAAARA